MEVPTSESEAVDDLPSVRAQTLSQFKLRTDLGACILPQFDSGDGYDQHSIGVCGC